MDFEISKEVGLTERAAPVKVDEPTKSEAGAPPVPDVMTVLLDWRRLASLRGVAEADEEDAAPGSASRSAEVRK